MKAIVQERYGGPDVLELREIDRPQEGDGEILVRVRATSVNPADWHFMRGEPRVMRLQAGLRAPKNRVLGCDVSGVVESAGLGVTGFTPGDEVYGCTSMAGFGGFAEYAVVPQDRLSPKPSNLSFVEAAAVPLAGMTALQGLRDHAGIEPGRRVLIIGATGGVGSFAIPIAKHLGAEVIAVCSGAKGDLASSLGADRVVDYTEEDPLASGPFDVIFQLAGTASPSKLRGALEPDGTLLISSGESEGKAIGPVGRTLKALAISPFVGQKLSSFTMKPTAGDLHQLRDLIEAGEISPVIERTYRLAEVPEAIRKLEEGHTRGKITVEV